MSERRQRAYLRRMRLLKARPLNGVQPRSRGLAGRPAVRQSWRSRALDRLQLRGDANRSGGGRLPVASCPLKLHPRVTRAPLAEDPAQVLNTAARRRWGEPLALEAG